MSSPRLTKAQRRAVEALLEGGTLHRPGRGERSWLVFTADEMTEIRFRDAFVDRIFEAVELYQDWGHYHSSAYAARCMAEGLAAITPRRVS